MSLQTWINEFYPVEAADATGSELEAAEHSLRKWTGALPENLTKHEIHQEPGFYGIVEDEPNGGNFVFSIDTCALCRRHHADDCRGCILVEIRSFRCFDNGDGNDRWRFIEGSPYSLLKKGDPRPMIDLLQQAVDALKSREQPPDAQ